MAEYCIHSFPRPRKGETPERISRKGELIASSLLENGLMLAPENFEVPLLDGFGQQIDGITVLQCRICFTEIEPSKLAAHSETFGPYSLVYDIDDLRRIGGLPVHYVPLPMGSHLYGLGSEILGGVADATRVLDSIVVMRQQMEQSPTLGLQWTRNIDGVDVTDGVRFNEEQTTILRSFFDELEKMCSSPFRLTQQKLLAATACFYPTEHPAYTGKLHYYRQREWRIVEIGLMQGEEPLAPRATSAQQEVLHEIDNDFFSKTVKVPTGRRINEWEFATIAERCRFLSRVGDLDVIGLARYLVVGGANAEHFSLREAFRARGVEVVTIDEFSKMPMSATASDPAI
jgi:hypothetical protein